MTAPMIPLPDGSWREPAAPSAPPSEDPAGRDASGRFTTGNPGRKRGSRNRVSREALEAVEGLVPDALAQLAIAVKCGHLPAVRLVIETVLPRGGRLIEIEGGADDPKALIRAAMDGKLTPDELGRFAAGVKTALDAAELIELRHRLDSVEQLIQSLKK